MALDGEERMILYWAGQLRVSALLALHQSTTESPGLFRPEATFSPCSGWDGFIPLPFQERICWSRNGKLSQSGASVIPHYHRVPWVSCGKANGSNASRNFFHCIKCQAPHRTSEVAHIDTLSMRLLGWHDLEQAHWLSWPSPDNLVNL